jgi:DNA transformation protein
MAPSEGFCDFLLDQMSALSGVSLRRMFGGAGLFRDGIMFGLIAEDTLYLKADDTSRPSFEAVGMGPFVYEAKEGRQMAMPYFQVPTDILEDRERLSGWARTAHDVAKKTAKPKAAKPKVAKVAAPAKKAPLARKKATPAKQRLH